MSINSSSTSPQSFINTIFNVLVKSFGGILENNLVAQTSSLQIFPLTIFREWSKFVAIIGSVYEFIIDCLIPVDP